MAATPSWNWVGYYNAVRNRPPRDTLLKALELFDADGPFTAVRVAIDLGCRSGVDTLALLQRGWRVLAIDLNGDGRRHLRALVPQELQSLLETRCAAFHEAALPLADLINASYSLPFCAPEQFPQVWANCVNALRPAGRFAAVHIGYHDAQLNMLQALYGDEEVHWR